MADRQSVDLRGLERRLRQDVAGDVAFGSGARALYATDASNYRVVPPGVVLPRTTEDLVAAVAACREFGAPVAMRGAGTSVAGQATGNGVVIDTSRHLRAVLELDPTSRLALVEPGVVLDDLQAAAAAHDLRFGPDPSTHNVATIGGMIGNNACGPRSVAWGTTAANVREIEVLLYDGTQLAVGAAGRGEQSTQRSQAVRPISSTTRRQADAVSRSLSRLMQDRLGLVRTALPPLPRRSSGYLLDWLLPERGRNVARALVGTEGTCVIVTKATVQLVPEPAARALLVLGYDDIYTAADHAPAVLPYDPLTVEGLDTQLVASALARGRTVPDLPAGGGLLYVEIAGESSAAAEDTARQVAKEVGARHTIIADPKAQRSLWRVREEGVGLATRMPGGLGGAAGSRANTEAWPGWEDAAVPPERLGSYLRGFRDLLAAHRRRAPIYGHFGEGCVHARIDFDLHSPGGRSDFREFIEAAADLVIAHGGVFSGEHGDGQARAELHERLYGRKVVDMFAAFKAIWDPDDRMNPGVLVRPRPLDENLRVMARPAWAAGGGEGARDRLIGSRTRGLALSADDGDLALALRRCVGVGACRSERGGVMCPSYRATHDERHSTRGRAHLLEEMLRGEVVTSGWRSSEVAEALDLCLGCKGCAIDCPVAVDMAAYRSEFLFHRYRRRVRPLAHYSLGWLPLWLRITSRAPRLANTLLYGRVSAGLGRRLAGIAPERHLPAVAEESLVRWYARWRRHLEDATGSPVVLWPDTFTSYLDPPVGQAAIRVLADAGLAARLPPGRVCCGLTWLSTGQLGRARKVVRASLRVLEPALAAELPIVVLEPSCAAALRGDLPELLPGDERAAALAGSVRTLSELLAEQAPDWRPPQVGGSALVQRHCHQYAVLGFGADERLLALAGIDAAVLDEGCCGLAGDFGMTRGRYGVSMAVGELGVLPAVRAAGSDTLILADGFSCRLQIAHGTGRQPLHLAQVLASRL